MADQTKIEWADASWNPITGCTPKSEGCEKCYAARMSKRFPDRFNNFEPTFHEQKLHDVHRWKTPKRVFVCSMGDLFHHEIHKSERGRVIASMHGASQHTYIILTKRPWLMEKYFRGCYIPANWWLGVSAETQERADARVPILLEIKANVRFVSVEPMLGPVSLKKWLGPRKINWVVCGKETGAGARPMDTDWAFDLRMEAANKNIPWFGKKFPTCRPTDMAFISDREFPQ